MTSVFTHGAYGANPNAVRYGAMAMRASKCGSKNFVYTPCHDERMAFPRHHHRRSDVPWRDCYTWQRLRWMVHDFRMFGLLGAVKKHYYIGEAWRRKDEKIFVGKDECGNKFWMSRRSPGGTTSRIMEPRDPHWFRGQSVHSMSTPWQKWMAGQTMHTPAQIQARGELGMNARAGRLAPFNVAHHTWSPVYAGEFFSRDPMWVPPGSVLNPEYRALEESGFSRWLQNRGVPLHFPFAGVHDYPDELVEEYYRGMGAFGKTNKGNDHDEWKA